MAGLRVYEEDSDREKVVARSSTPLKTSVVLSATPMNAFMCTMSCGLIQDGMVPTDPKEVRR